MNSASLGPSDINHRREVERERCSFHKSRMSKDFLRLLKARATRMKECARASCLLNEASQNVWDTLSEVPSPRAVPRFSPSSSCLSFPWYLLTPMLFGHIYFLKCIHESPVSKSICHPLKVNWDRWTVEQQSLTVDECCMSPIEWLGFKKGTRAIFFFKRHHALWSQGQSCSYIKANELWNIGWTP